MRARLRLPPMEPLSLRGMTVLRYSVPTILGLAFVAAMVVVVVVATQTVETTVHLTGALSGRAAAVTASSDTSDPRYAVLRASPDDARRLTVGSAAVVTVNATGGAVSRKLTGMVTFIRLARTPLAAGPAEPDSMQYEVIVTLDRSTDSVPAAGRSTVGVAISGARVRLSTLARDFLFRRRVAS